MTDIYTFVTGPLAWVAFGIFIIGSVYRLVSMYALAKAKDGSSLAYMSWFYGLRSILAWMVPFKSKGWQSDPLATVTTFVFHIAFLLVAVFLNAHVVLWDTAFGISIPSLPTYLGDIISILAIVCCAIFAYRRLTLPHVKGITRNQDWFALILVVLPFITGVLAYHQVGSVLVMTTLHVIFAELLIALIPFTRLSHALFILFTRAYMGSEFGGVRHANDW
ncbi:nitrate reductase [Pseudodesulfovibrio sp. JC047]|uniref:TmcC family electron transfer complex membrane anchor subunit n=1 Tax=Pseudodesulfovibrio sp. JC047 TaxID=2683199 RepID=UPI0013D02A67|nr:respiratory nitrate reductase subunit gamma [Pseudodesulfovibrio sp. JC047]NDV18518.1 nitrate reductase [Pseudodesulfovibrio sp. JC047]